MRLEKSIAWIYSKRWIYMKWFVLVMQAKQKHWPINMERCKFNPHFAWYHASWWHYLTYFIILIARLHGHCARWDSWLFVWNTLKCQHWLWMMIRRANNWFKFIKRIFIRIHISFANYFRLLQPLISCSIP